MSEKILAICKKACIIAQLVASAHGLPDCSGNGVTLLVAKGPNSGYEHCSVKPDTMHNIGICTQPQ